MFHTTVVITRITGSVMCGYFILFIFLSHTVHHWRLNLHWFTKGNGAAAFNVKSSLKGNQILILIPQFSPGLRTCVKSLNRLDCLSHFKKHILLGSLYTNYTFLFSTKWNIYSSFFLLLLFVWGFFWFVFWGVVGWGLSLKVKLCILKQIQMVCKYRPSPPP